MNYNIFNFDSRQINILINAEKYSKSIMKTDDLHGIGHVERVINNILQIHRIEGGNLFILLVAAWLHDIGRVSEKEEGISHAIISARLASVFLENQEFKMQKDEINQIIRCIESHSFSVGNVQNSLEEQILSDADKLDALGSIGIYRASAFQHEIGTGIEGLIHHFNEKLLHLYELMNTNTAREMSIERTKQMKNYLENLLKEISKRENYAI